MEKTEVIKHFDSISGRYDKYLSKNRYYHSQMNNFVASIIPLDAEVLEIGCATGELLGRIKTRSSTGIDISPKMIEIAQKKFPSKKFLCTDLSGLGQQDKFDYVIMSNLLDYLPDIMDELDLLKKHLTRDSKVIITTVNPIWEPILRIAAFFRLRTPDGPRNFVTNNDIDNLLYVLDYEVIEKGYRLFFPKWIPLLSYLVNIIFPRIPGIRNFCIMQYIVAKLKPSDLQKRNFSCSVIIPCYNEAGNIKDCIERIPRMGKFTEIVVVDDGSSDNTAQIVKDLCEKRSDIKLISYSPNEGKGKAVKKGFDSAIGDVLMILDADMAVLPEELPKFFFPIEQEKAEFVNGTRMIYPREKKSMKILNFIGNKIFGIILSLIIGQRNTDTLCGTKAFKKKDYIFMEMGACKRGDFDLLFGATKLRLKMIEMPVHYKKRSAGVSKMKPFKHGWQLLKICWRGINKIA